MLVGIISAGDCDLPAYYGPWHDFFGVDVTQADAYDIAYEVTETWCGGSHCQYSEAGCTLLWQGSMRAWKCEVRARMN